MKVRAGWRWSGLLCVLIGIVSVRAYPQTATGDTVYQLRGRVVNGITGRSLSRALVMSTDRRLATMTDGAGRFSLTVSLPPQANGANAASGPRSMVMGGYGGDGLMLTAKKPGYLDPEQPTSFALDATLGTQEAVLKLMPAGSIDGRVTAATTDSPHDVRVSLMQHRVQDGSYMWMTAGSDSTDSHGDFHFGNLKPGEYTVVTAEWRGDQPVGQPRKEITQQYPPVYLGDASDMQTAAKFHVHPGEELHADLHLRLATYYPITIPVALSAGGAVNVQVLSTGANRAFALGYNGRDGKVEGALPNGTYTLLLTGNGGGGGFASVPVHVQGAPVAMAAVTLSPGPRVPVHVHTEFTGSGKDVPFSMNLTLRPDGGVMGGYGNGNLAPGGGEEFFVENAQPGQYVAQAQPSVGYVAAMRCGGVDLLRGDLVLQAGGTADPIDVTVRDDGANIKGTVTMSDGALPSHSFVLLLPTDSSAHFTQAFAGPDGTFQLANLPPGTYRAFAVQTPMMQIPFRDAEAMRVFDGKGKTFTATAGEQVQVEAPMLKDEEAMVQ